MTTAMLERPMAKAKQGPGRPTTGRDDVPVKIDRRLVDQARVIAAYRKTTLADLLSTMLAGPIEKAQAQMAKEFNRTASKGGEE